jgi:hypothetical protein
MIAKLLAATIEAWLSGGRAKQAHLLLIALRGQRAI